MLIDNFALNELDFAAMLHLFSIPKRIENKLDQYVYFIVLNFKENSTLKHNFVKYVLNLFENLPRNINSIDYGFCHFNLNNLIRDFISNKKTLIGAEYSYAFKDNSFYKKHDDLRLYVIKSDFYSRCSQLLYPDITIAQLNTKKLLFPPNKFLNNSIKEGKTILSIRNQVMVIQIDFVVFRTRIACKTKGEINQNLEIVAIYHKYNNTKKLFGRFFSVKCNFCPDCELNDLQCQANTFNSDEGQQVARKFIYYIEKIFFIRFSSLNFYMSRFANSLNKISYLSHFDYENRAYAVFTNVICNFTNFKNIIKNLKESKDYEIELKLYESRLIYNSRSNIDSNNVKYFYDRLNIDNYIDINNISTEQYNSLPIITIVIETSIDNQMQHVYISIPIFLLTEVRRIRLYQETFIKQKKNLLNFNLQKMHVNIQIIIFDIMNEIIIKQPTYIIQNFLDLYCLNY
ncbi:hypothetical protein COBT_002243, partial [Conglomerata obtusa]